MFIKITKIFLLNFVCCFVLFFAMTVHAFTHEIDANGIDIYSMPASTTNQIDFPYNATDNTKHYDLIFEELLPQLPLGLAGALSRTGDIFTYLISGKLSNANVLFSVTERVIDFTIKIKDKFDAVGAKQFKFKILNRKPVIDRIYCHYTSKTSETDNTDKLYFSDNIIDNKISARAERDFYCSIEAHDPDNNVINSYTAISLPAGLHIDGSQIRGPITSDVDAEYEITFYAYDEFNLASEPKTATIEVNFTYCGDGDPQYFGNSEGFLEECEAGGTGTSNEDQYLCTNCEWGGGWCGDGFCDTARENKVSCCEDCGPAPFSQTYFAGNHILTIPKCAMDKIYITCQGAGGAGGAGAPEWGCYGGPGGGGGGGGAGQYIPSITYDVIAGNSYVIKVGAGGLNAGGVGNAPGQNLYENTFFGNNGGDITINDDIICKGGAGGGNGGNRLFGSATAGSGGLIDGQDGQGECDSENGYCKGGNGGGTIFGAGGAGGAGGNSGSDGVNAVNIGSGGGGGGGADGWCTSGGIGGNGADGFIKIKW